MAVAVYISRDTFIYDYRKRDYDYGESYRIKVKYVQRD